jgi:hypothetical protein
LGPVLAVAEVFFAELRVYKKVFKRGKSEVSRHYERRGCAHRPQRQLKFAQLREVVELAFIAI